MLKRTHIYESHIALGARMVDFGGWEMPVQYSGILDEHAAVRTMAGLFDVSHMGRFLLLGPDSTAFLQYITTYDVSRIEVGRSSYSLLCDTDGGIVDDIFIYRLPNTYMVVVNAANRQKDWDWLLGHARKFNVKLVDYSDQWAMIAMQGPAAETLLAESGGVEGADLSALPFHGIVKGRLFGVPESLIARTGYTGEDGFELFFDASRAIKVWNKLLELGEPGTVKPCGLGARDSLRFEPCLALYGHEISLETNPFEARLGWVVKLDQGDFVGHDALVRIKEQGPKRLLVGFEMVGRGIARAGYPIHSVDGIRIGEVTTGMHAPTIGKPLGMGYVPVELSKPDSEFDVIIREKPVRVRVVKMPFYKPRYKK